MIMTHLESFGDLFVISAKVLPDPLVNGFQRFETVSFLGGMDARTLKGAVIDADEDKRRSFFHRDRGRLASPRVILDTR